MSVSTEDIEREYVKGKLARLFYLAQCKHKGWSPRDRVDSWAYEYADIAVSVLGYDRDALLTLSDPAMGGVS